MRIKSIFKYRPGILLILLVVSIGSGWLFFSGCSETNNIRNVLLVSIDTCRADYLSCYGYPRRTTPNIDQLAQESILFENAYSTIPLTLPAHCSMLTGTIPPYHGVHDNPNYKLHHSNVTLPELLKDNGFSTGAIISSFILDSRFGLDQGFDTYDDRVKNPLDVNIREGEVVSRLALEWLEKHKSERFFLFLHFYDPHLRYEPPQPFASKFHDNPYAGEIAYADHCIGQVLEKLKALGLYDSTLLIITSDHGEMLGEHGEDTHGYFIYQSSIKVPMIFKRPGHHRAMKIGNPVGIIDIVPTICATLGIATPPQVQGKDLSPYFEKKQPIRQERYFYCESLSPTKYNGNSLLGVVTDRWKYIQTTRPELYDLIENPNETKNLINKEPHRARILRGHLEQLLEKSVRDDKPNSTLALDEESRKRLESLGYLAGTTAKEDFKFDQSKKDPKDLIELHARSSNVDGLNHLGAILVKQGRIKEAIEQFSEALQIDPEDARTHLNLGITLANHDSIPEAMKHFSEALRMNPDYAEAHNGLGFCQTVQGRVDEAIRHYSEALRINPSYPEAHNGLGAALVNQGRIDEAVKHFSKALQINPNFANAKSNLREAMKFQE